MRAQLLSAQFGVGRLGLAALVAALSLSACSRSKNGKGAGGEPPTPNAEQQAKGPEGETAVTPRGTVTVPAGQLPIVQDGGSRLSFPTGEFIAVDTVNGVSYITVEAALDEASFKRALALAKSQSMSQAEMIARLEAPLAATVEALGLKVGGLTAIRLYPEIGFFVAQLPLTSYQSLTSIEGLPANIVLNPVVISPVDERTVRKMDASLVQEILQDPRLSTEAFSGLKRMGIPEFLSSVKGELAGTEPDGAQVKVGVTDTGVTLNHPSFEDAEGAQRIVYMKDFTGEGRLYFNPAAKLEVTATDGDETSLKISAEVLPVVSGAMAKPVADDFKSFDGLALVNGDLRQALLTPNNGAKLAAFSEAQFASAGEFVDLNQNGKTDDAIFALLFPDGQGYKLHLAFATMGEGDVVTLDFRKSAPVGNWNDTKQTVKLAAEKFGFDIRGMKLKSKVGADVDVIGASIVGFDPGNHGSHVSGIIAGRKTIANDAENTLARGAAPNAKLMVNRVCANNGGCVSTEALIDLALNGAEVINMSLGGLSPFNDGYNVEEIIIDRLTEQKNVLFVISAGNSGPGINTVGSPSTARFALSVGATASRSLIERQYQWPAKGKPGALPTDEADDDFLLFFSSRGPTAAGGFKPNIAAPGTELSAVQLNAAAGGRSGLDVYWGTSMAAPSATGAIALLIDAAKRYNALNPTNALPVDALTIRKVVIASARPFDVTRFDPTTGESTRGQYTWIDQGLGMINLPRAWEALKAERDSRLPSAVFAVANDVRTDIRLDYQVRVLRTNPNGLPYDGSLELPADMMAITGPRFGRGLWLDARSQESLYEVQIARRLPYSATLRDDAGDLKRQLVTTKDEFAVKTVIYGSDKQWVKAGTLQQLDCKTAPTAALTVLGEGAIDAFGPTTGSSTGPRDSTLHVCVDRAVLESLPPGDHGALIMAYRKDGDKKEANAEIIVPVYVTVPNKTLAGSGGYQITGKVTSFGVARHYVSVPEGTSLVSVKLEVASAQVNGTVVTGCQGVRLYAYEAGNTVLPAEIAGTASIARNCNDRGASNDATRVVTYARTNPRAGIWNLHVFGRYQFAESEYKLTVEFAKVKTSVAKIAGTPAALDGTFDFEVLDASFNAKPSAERSTLALSGLSQTVSDKVKTEDQVIVPDADGKVARTYDAGVAMVSFATGGSPGNDIDLFALECEDEALEQCAVVGEGTTSTDVELVSFAPAVGKFYAALVLGYSVEQGDGSFQFTETRRLSGAESGVLTVTELAPSSFRIGHEFDQEASELLKNALFTSGKYSVTGEVTLRTDAGSIMTRIPVEVKAAQP